MQECAKGGSVTLNVSMTFVSLLHLESLSRVIMYPFKLITTTSFALLQQNKTYFVHSKLYFCHFIIWQERLKETF